MSAQWKFISGWKCVLNQLCFFPPQKLALSWLLYIPGFFTIFCHPLIFIPRSAVFSLSHPPSFLCNSLLNPPSILKILFFPFPHPHPLSCCHLLHSIHPSIHPSIRPSVHPSPSCLERAWLTHFPAPRHPATLLTQDALKMLCECTTADIQPLLMRMNTFGNTCIQKGHSNTPHLLSDLILEAGWEHTHTHKKQA